MNKNVTFNLEKNIIYYTYNFDEYNRSQINSLYNQIRNNNVSNQNLVNIFNKLNKYKLEEMIVHKKSLCNTTIY